MLKAEKQLSESREAAVPEKVFQTDFRNEAAAYLKTPNNDAEDSYTSKEEAPAPVTAKNTANLTTILAVAQPHTTIKSAAKKSRSKPQQPRKTMKAAKPRKKTTFKIVKKRSEGNKWC